jgi:hypothetical protein
MTDIADYIYNNYSKTGISKEQLKQLYETCPDKFIVIRNNGSINAIGFYFKLSDKLLEDFKNNRLKVDSAEDIDKCFNSDGDNVLFAFASGDFKSLRKGVKEVIKKENPKTVSWMKADLSKPFIYKRS